MSITRGPVRSPGTGVASPFVTTSGHAPLQNAHGHTHFVRGFLSGAREVGAREVLILEITVNADRRAAACKVCEIYF